ncbi:MAG: bifunctional riboflavin kinase/FAD synthetase [Candidatus Aminicenantes bacterium]|nr:bifunctional riboflavin kinase/FAD synthetase [Candidatus Aminicenantes bacterium]
MKVIRTLNQAARKITRDSVLAIGIFDGFHRGHQKIIQFVLKEARKTGQRAGALTFYPHPESSINHRPLLHIQTLKQRLQSLESAGLDYSLIFSLEKEIFSWSGEEFARKILAEELRVSQVVVGENFHFGYRRQSSASDLKIFGQKFGFKVKILKRVIHQGQPVSSSLIRRLLQAGQIEQANALLGHPYEICGRVIRGRQIGRQLGFPTANLKTENEILPTGVFLAMTRKGEKLWPGLLNIGFRPTFNERTMTVENLLLDFKGSLYGQILSILLLKKLRRERRFKSIEALKQQIAEDVKQAKKYFEKQRYY